MTHATVRLAAEICLEARRRERVFPPLGELRRCCAALFHLPRPDAAALAAASLGHARAAWRARKDPSR